MGKLKHKTLIQFFFLVMPCPGNWTATGGRRCKVRKEWSQTWLCTAYLVYQTQKSGNNPIPESELEMLLIKLVNRKMLAFGTLKGVTFLFEMKSHGQVHVSYEWLVLSISRLAYGIYCARERSYIYIYIHNFCLMFVWYC